MNLWDLCAQFCQDREHEYQYTNGNSVLKFDNFYVRYKESKDSEILNIIKRHKIGDDGKLFESHLKFFYDKNTDCFRAVVRIANGAIPDYLSQIVNDPFYDDDDSDLICLIKYDFEQVHRHNRALNNKDPFRMVLREYNDEDIEAFYFPWLLDIFYPKPFEKV
jgi:hypothetical protein